MNNLRNFNGIFRKVVTYDKFQGNEKHGFTLSLGDTFLEKLQEGSN